MIIYEYYVHVHVIEATSIPTLPWCLIPTSDFVFSSQVRVPRFGDVKTLAHSPHGPGYQKHWAWIGASSEGSYASNMYFMLFSWCLLFFDLLIYFFETEKLYDIDKLRYPQAMRELCEHQAACRAALLQPSLAQSYTKLLYHAILISRSWTQPTHMHVTNRVVCKHVWTQSDDWILTPFVSHHVRALQIMETALESSKRLSLGNVKWRCTVTSTKG